ncbi:MAG TPA: hypothetical protein VIU40_12415, partial [Geobacteraceae bacterium]
ILGLLLLLAARVPDIFSTPQFWADEGASFFKDAWCSGFLSVFKHYCGYYHAIPRLIAFAATFFPPLHAPALYCYGSLALTGLVLSLIMSERLDLPHKPLLALAVVLVPHDGEVFANLTNIQWILALGLVVMALLQPAKSRLMLWADAGYVCLAGFTGPYITMVLPVFAGRLWLERKNAPARQRLLLLTAIGAAVAGIQMYSVSYTNEDRQFQYQSLAESFRDIFSHLGNVIDLSVSRLFGSSLQAVVSLTHHNDINRAGIELIIGVSLVCAMVFLIMLAYDMTVVRRYRFEKCVCIYFIAALMFAALYRNSFLTSTKFNLFLYQASDRYFYIPKVMLCWALILAVGKRWSGAVAACFLGLILLTSLLHLRRDPWVNYNWPYWAARIAAHEPVEVPINPTGWKIELRCDTK